MLHDVWQTCVFIPGLSSEECASWVQAWGTIAAIVAAIGIAWWQRRADRDAIAATARAKAEIAATSILLKLHPIMGCLQSVARELAAVQRTPEGIFDPARSISLLEQQSFPTDDELIALADHDAQCARWLIRARNLAAQGAMALRLLQRHDPATRPAKVGQLAELLLLAEGQLEKAEAVLETLAPSDE